MTDDLRKAAPPAESEPKTAWAHLPNAVHIDRVLVHVKAHPDKWDLAREAASVATRDSTLYAALYAARHATWDAVRVAVWDAAWVAVRGVARISTRDAIAALIAFDYAGELFSLPRFVVRAMADKGDHAAVLLYPAMLAMGEEK